MEDIFGRYAVMTFGAMFAAVVAGFFAFMNLVVSKEQKVSEFRQEWINSLRDSIANYISSLAYLSVLYQHHNDLGSEKKNKYEMVKDVEDTYAKVNESYNDIIFRINDNEEDPKGKIINSEFLCALSLTRELYNANDFTRSRQACEELREKTKPLLKFEWKRVKNGERNYKIARNLSAFILCLGVALSVLSIYLIWSASDPKLMQEVETEQVVKNTSVLKLKQVDPVTTNISNMPFIQESKDKSPKEVVIYFDINEFEIPRSGVEKLQSFCKKLGDSNKEVELFGYADLTGNEKRNLTLSKDRQEIVRQWIRDECVSFKGKIILSNNHYDTPILTTSNQSEPENRVAILRH